MSKQKILLIVAISAMAGCSNPTVSEKNDSLTYTVRFDSRGGSAVTDQSVVSGGKVTKPASDPTYTGYVFAGWYKEAAGINAWDFAVNTVVLF